jgi:phenylacetate-CoA ligase
LPIDFKIRDFAYPLGILRLRRFFERSQWMPPEKLRAYQESRLRGIVEQAYSHVPYYRRLFDERGLKPRDICQIEDLQKLPLLSRKTVREHFRELRASNAWRFRPAIAETSGTSGTPLRFLVDRPANVLEFAYYWRHWSWAGYRLGDRWAHVRYEFFVRQNETIGKPWHFQEHTRRLYLNSLLISREHVGEFARALRIYRPQFIHSRPSNLYCIAMFLRERGLDDITFRAVFCGGETVTLEHREMIEKTFSCKVLDSYGHMERCIAVSQCPEGGYHLNSDYGVLELHDGKKSGDGGVMGRVVCTSLHKMAMPFLRYQIEDYLELYENERQCPCGRTLPLIRAVHGRRRPIIVTPDGRPITTIFGPFSRVNGIRRYQVIHEKPALLVVRVVKGPDFTLQDEEGLRFWLKVFIGNGMGVRLEYVSEEDLRSDDLGMVQPLITRAGAWI